VTVAYLITVRMKSTRLPQKALRPLAGRPMLAYQIDRLRHARRVHEIVLCTSTDSQDDGIEALAIAEGVACYRGDADDVLARLAGAAAQRQADLVLNITGDCPFVDPDYADRVADALSATGADLVRAFDLPHGAYSYGIKPSALARVLEIKADRHTEAWGRYFTDTDLFTVHDLAVDDRHRRPGLRLTIDYPEDLAFAEAVAGALHRDDRPFTLDELLAYTDAHPEVVALNAHCGALYRQRFASQSGIRLKPRYRVARAALVGCGAAGQRHARNLRRLGIEEVFAWRSRLGHTQDLDPALRIREVESLESLADAHPDIAIVSNPTSLHVEAALALVPHVRGVFVEKPIAASLADAVRLAQAVAAARVTSFVGYNLQFHPAIARVCAAEDDIGQRVSFQCQVGQYLPDWHPAEDYRAAYFAREDLGGGMIRTLSHELHLAISLYGPARRVSAVAAPYASLATDVDLIADVQVQHAGGGVSQIHLDAVQRVLHRSGVVSGERGWLRYDLVRPSLTAQREGDAAPVRLWHATDFDANDPYVHEMQAFLDYTREGRMRHDHDVWRGLETMALIDAALVAASSGQTADVPTVHAPG
jgi:spore coat polysaccharide biosynthesis protein SpsF (cytidylyltransferase family)/predicted dehydrogenase